MSTSATPSPVSTAVPTIGFNPKRFHRTDLSNIPVAAVIESLDYEQILSELKANLIEQVPESLKARVAQALTLESEPMVMLLEACAYRELHLRHRMNVALESILLAEAVGTNLDALAANPPWGIERLAHETDERFKRRIQLAIASTSSAGSLADYQFYALSADLRVQDCTVLSPKPGVVEVYLLADHSAASPELLEVVNKVLSADDVRPLTDQVTVHAAEIVPYQVQAKLWFYPGPDRALVQQQAESQLHQTTAQLFRLGYDVRLSALYAALHVEGVQRVELAMPMTDLVIQSHQAAQCMKVSLEGVGYDE